METSKKAKTKAGATNPREELTHAFREHLLTTGKKPVSVFSFTKEIGIKEEDFYTHFGSFHALEKSIWKGYITTVNERLVADQTYGSYSVRGEDTGVLLYLGGGVKSRPKFCRPLLAPTENPAPLPSFIKDFKITFEEWINPVLLEGKQTGEVAMRPYIDRKYDSIFWLHLLFILQFWVKDDSANFEKTDVAIEKSVNLAFDLIGKGVLDNALDFGKFLYQNR